MTDKKRRINNRKMIDLLRYEHSKKNCYLSRHFLVLVLNSLLSNV